MKTNIKHVFVQRKIGMTTLQEYSLKKTKVFHSYKRSLEK